MDFAWMAFSQAWQVTALILSVLLTTRVATRNRPHLAYMLWLVVLVKCVTPPVWSSPTGAFSWLQTVIHSETTEAAHIDEPRIGIDIDFVEDPLPPVDDVVVRLQPLAFEVAATDLAVRQLSDDDSATNPVWVFVAIWCGGVVLAILITAYRWAKCIWKLWRSPAIESPELELLVAKLARKLRVKRRVKLLVTTSRVGPAVMGLLRPLIVLPEVVVRNKQPVDLEAILAHELIHVRRGDLLLGLLQVCAKAVWWFYPLVLWVSRLATREAERCCDEEVIGELGCDPKRYAHSLLEVLELKRTLYTVPASPGMKPVEVTSQRLERIMKLGQGCHRQTPRSCWVIMLVLAAAVLPGAAFIAADDESETREFLAPVLSGGGAEGGVSTGRFVSDDWEELIPDHPQVISIPDDGTILLGGIKRWRAEPGKPHPVVVASYLSETVIANLRKESDIDDSEALQKFGNLLIQEARLADEPLPLRDRIRIWDGTITIAASPEEHRRLEAAVERLEQYSVAQFTFEIRFVAAPERVVKQKIKDWQLTPLDLGAEDGDGQQRPLHTELERPLPTEQAKPRAKASAATTTNSPAIYKVVSSEEASRLLSEFEQDKRTNVLATPKVTLFNGQSATIADTVQRPFVVGVTTVGGKEMGVQPQIRVVESGNVVRVRPLLRGTNRLWLDYDVKVSHIEDVDETTVQAAGWDEPVTLQVPKVFTARVESAVEFELDKTVIIGGLTAAAKGKGRKDQLLVMMSVRKSEVDQRNVMEIKQSRTGKLQFGASVKSDAGVLGSVAVDAPTIGDARHKMVPILGPLTAGGDGALRPISDDEVLRALDEQQHGGPPLPKKKAERFNVRIVKEKIADYTDPPRFVPTIGPAELRHAHYKCTVTSSVWVEHDSPIPYKVEEEIREVVYIDHRHYHMVGQAAISDPVGQPMSHPDDKSIKAALRRTGSIHLKDATLSMWIDEIQEVWDVYIVSDIPDTQVTLSAHFEDATLQEVLTAVLPQQGCSFRRVDNSLVVTRTASPNKQSTDARVTIRNPVDEAEQLLAQKQEVNLSDVPLSDALERIAEHAGVNLRIDAASLAAEGVRTDTPVTLQLSLPISAKSALTLILDPLNLRYEVAGETVVVRGDDDSDHFVAVYNVADLITTGIDKIKPQDFTAEPGATPAERRFAILTAAIQQQVAKDTWQATGGAGVIEAFPTNLSLVIRQTKEGHKAVAKFLGETRGELGLPAVGVRKPNANPPRKRSPELYNKVYNVAELVIPRPSFPPGDAQDKAVADFDTLIELITSTIATDTWDESGGAGTIQSFPTNLSLVVSQTTEVHAQIADLLEQLRRLQDIQVTLEARFMRIPAGFFERLGIAVDFADGQEARLPGIPDPQHSALLTDIEMFLLHKAIASSDEASTLAAPKITLFNGQQASISLSDEAAEQGGVFQFQAVCTDDRRAVRLGFAVGAKADIKQAKVHTIKKGNTLLLNVTDEVTSRMLGASERNAEIPLVSKVPYVSRLFKTKQPVADDKILLLITPRIIVREEEEKIILGGVTPRIIVQEEEEEEELLGIELEP